MIWSYHILSTFTYPYLQTTPMLPGLHKQVEFSWWPRPKPFMPWESPGPRGVCCMAHRAVARRSCWSGWRSRLPMAWEKWDSTAVHMHNIQRGRGGKHGETWGNYNIYLIYVDIQWFIIYHVKFYRPGTWQPLPFGKGGAACRSYMATTCRNLVAVLGREWGAWPKPLLVDD